MLPQGNSHHGHKERAEGSEDNFLSGLINQGITLKCIANQRRGGRLLHGMEKITFIFIYLADVVVQSDVQVKQIARGRNIAVRESTHP